VREHTSKRRLGATIAVMFGAVLAFAAIGGTGLAGGLAKPAKSQYGPGQYQYGAKVTICHHANSNKTVTIRVSINGWLNGHQKHGDTLGPCAAGATNAAKAEKVAKAKAAAKAGKAAAKAEKTAKVSAPAPAASATVVASGASTKKAAKANKPTKSNSKGPAASSASSGGVVSSPPGNGNGNGQGHGNGNGKH
jgi:hypothetical protein